MWRDGYDYGYADGHRQGWRDGLAERGDIPQDLIRRAIHLCHPDRHPAERAGEANAVTAQLLDLLAAKARAA